MRADFARDRAALLLAWADFIDGKTPVSNVIDFLRVRGSMPVAAQASHRGQ
jgi:hypothetical protein